jgi:hypothetical protein
MWHVWERGRLHIGFWWGNLKEYRQTGRPRCRWEDNIKMNQQFVLGKAWNGLIWLRRGTHGGLQ